MIKILAAALLATCELEEDGALEDGDIFGLAFGVLLTLTLDNLS